MIENPYQSPAAAEAGPRSSGWFSDRPSWGCFSLVWPLGYLFAWFWLVGSAGMYATLIGLEIHLNGAVPSYFITPPQPYYDLAGYAVFGMCLLAALIVGAVLVVRRKAEFRQPWPDWRMALRCLIWSTMLVGPVWALLARTNGGIRYFPGESAWIGICEVSLLGIVHGRLCQQGWRYHRPYETSAAAGE